jgi:4-diphosphocytidyl-2-C-methyl-D-erythritol kinase
MVLAIQAPAKLNRFLAVLGRRADGFHELELVTTVLEGVAELTDTLEGEAAAELSLTISGPTGEGLVADESNLVIKAWRLLEEAAKRPLPAALRLEKHIPHGAGLGGGSSDAAAALGLGNRMFDLGLDDEVLLRMAACLGSDVPLFLLGGTVLGLGRGERVFSLRPVPLEPILLVHPGLHVSTPSVYRALQDVGYPDAVRGDRHTESLASLPEGAAPPWRNDLTGAALWVCPPLAEVRDALRDTGGEPLLCGSGSCWAARYESPQARDAAVGRISGLRPDWGFWRV